MRNLVCAEVVRMTSRCECPRRRRGKQYRLKAVAVFWSSRIETRWVRSPVSSRSPAARPLGDSWAEARTHPFHSQHGRCDGAPLAMLQDSSRIGVLKTTCACDERKIGAGEPEWVSQHVRRAHRTASPQESSLVWRFVARGDGILKR